MIKDQVKEINFVKSAENDSDIMTKNQQGATLHVCKVKIGVYSARNEMMRKTFKMKKTGRMFRELDLAM